LDYSDLPSWKEWAANRAAAAKEKQENAIKFLREIG
jgi:hypothetical protein